MQYTPEEYNKLVRSMAKKSPMGTDLLWAFLVGGAICALGQLIMEGWLRLGLNRDDASTAASMSLIFLSALFTALDLYHRLAKHAGAGTLVPVTGFANSIVSPAIEYKSEGLVGAGGMASKMFSIAGPVLVFGIGSSVVYGLILCLLNTLGGGA